VKFKFALLVFVGGGLGAMLREFAMLLVPNPVDGFPLDILVANLVAALLLGLTVVLYRRQVVTDGVNALVATGVTGGLSTFSSFAYGMSVLATASRASAVVAATYVVASLLLGYGSAIAGMKLGERLTEWLRTRRS
jgi:fluoride exporter